MAPASNLYRRTSGVYVVRLAVPQRLRPALGKREIHVSTGSRVLALAKTVAAGVLGHWREKFLDLERLQLMDVERLVAGSPELSIDSYLPLSEAGMVSGLGEDGLLRLAADGHLKLFYRSGGLEGYFVPYEELETEPGEADVFALPSSSQMAASFHATSAPSIVAVRKPAVVASDLLKARECVNVLFAVVGRKDVGFAPHDPVTVTRGALEVRTAEVNAVRLRLAGRVTSDQLELARANRKTVAVKSRKGDKRLSEAVAAYMEERSRRCGSDQARRVMGALDLFVELMGDRRLDEVDRDVIKEYRDRRLPQVPARENKIRLTHKTGTVSESIKAIEGTDWPRISLPEQQKRISWLEEMFRWLLAEHWISDNPAIGIESGGAYKRRVGKKRPQDARDAFSREELKQLFSHQWYQTGRGEQTKTQTYREFQPRNYWLPLLGLYTGARIRELCQMELKDIRQDDHGTWYFDINDSGSDSEPDSAKSLKNRHSMRRIPVHPHLLKLGLIDWRDRLEKAGFSRLFPELSYDPIKGYGKSSTKWFGSFLDSKFGWARDGKRTFHSFRHTLITECRNRHNIPEHVLAQITGHGRGSTAQGQVYTKDRAPHELFELISDVDFGINEIAPFDPDAGMNALEDALGRKNGGRGTKSGAPV